MTSRDFCYWLQGYFEIATANAEPGTERPHGGLTERQLTCVMRHLALVFKHEIDPSYGDKKHQKELNDIHKKQNVNDVLVRC